MKNFLLVAIAIFAFQIRTQAGTVTGVAKTILTWDKTPSGDPWANKFIFQIQPGDGSPVKDLWSYTDNKEFISSLIASASTGNSVTVDYDSTDVLSGRKHAIQVIYNN